VNAFLKLSFLFFGFASVRGAPLAEASIVAKVTSPVAHGDSKVGVGSELSLTFGGESGAHAGVFLGKLVQPSGAFSNYLLLDDTDSTVYLTNQNDASFGTDSLQTVLRQYDQVDGTCTGYAIDHLMQQMFWSGFSGNGTLKTTLSTEEGRTQLLVSSIDAYYLATQHRNSLNTILNGDFGKQYGFTCPKRMFEDPAKAIAFMNQKMKKGLPVLVSFYIGPNMVESDIKIKDYETGVVDDNRLWVPRQIGERNSGGHSVVAVSAFQSQGKTKLLMLDSDWTSPRVWDLEAYLGGNVAISEIEFYACDGKDTEATGNLPSRR
jgi:hypothetical protein